MEIYKTEKVKAGIEVKFPPKFCIRLYYIRFHDVETLGPFIPNVKLQSGQK